MSGDRPLPHSLEAEGAVLGAMLINSSVYESVAGTLKPEDFFRRGHAEIYAALAYLADQRSVALDLITLSDELARRGQLESAGGRGYIAGLTDGVPRSANVAYYAGIVKETAIYRRLIQFGTRLADEAYTGSKHASDLVMEADKTLVGFQGDGRGRVAWLKDCTGPFLEDLSLRVNRKGKLIGTATGFRTLDELTFGWQPGDLIVIAARPSIGKSVFAMNSAVAAASHGKQVRLVSLEMRRRQIEYRLSSHLSGVMLTRILGGHLGEEDFDRLSEALAKMETFPIAIDDQAAQTVWDIRSACRQQKAESGLDLVIVDYFGLLHGTLDRRANRQEQLADASRRLKVLADELACPILLLAQLNRKGDDRADKTPQLSDLRETGALEQDADMVCFLHRAHHRQSGKTECIVEKQRNGPTGTVNLMLDRDTQTFRDEGLEPEQLSVVPDAVPAVKRRRKKW